jgi:hypothetical protein
VRADALAANGLKRSAHRVHGDVDQHIEDADDVLTEYRAKFSSLIDSANSIFRDKTELRQSSASIFSHFGNATDSLEVSAVLEKYSDKLLEIVSQKIASKVLSKADR